MGPGAGPGHRFDGPRRAARGLGSADGVASGYLPAMPAPGEPLLRPPITDGRIEPRLAAAVSHSMHDTGLAKLHCVQAGEGPPIVLLHGVPEFWYVWRWQIPALADAGFRVVAPDLRGQGGSQMFGDADDFTLDLLVSDVIGLLDALELPSAVLVGHGHGGLVAWLTAMAHPDRIRGIAALNAPHPSWLGRMANDPIQVVRSAASAATRIPLLPERVLGLGAGRLPRERWERAIANPAARTDGDLQLFVDALLQSEDTRRGAVNFTRALELFGGRFIKDSLAELRRPALVLWGDNDPTLRPRYAAPPEGWCRRLDVQRFPVGRFVMLDEPDPVSASLASFATLAFEHDPWEDD